MSMWQGIVHFVSVWGSNELVVFFAGVLVTLIGVVFRSVLLRFLSFIARRFWSMISKRGKDAEFERAYLEWIINKHRYLGLLPARVVASKWGEGRRVVDLEKVYVALQASDQQGDHNWYETSLSDPSSWRRQPWWHFLFKEARFFWPLFSVQLLFLAISFLVFAVLHVLFFAILMAVLIALLSGLSLYVRRKIHKGMQSYTPGDLALTIDAYRHLVLRGDPGSGKTTLLRYLAILCARSKRGNKKQEDIPGQVRKKLRWTTCPFPLMVTLRLHDDVTHWSKEKCLLDLFAEELPTELAKCCPDGFWARRLARGNCLVLLDAFDELGSIEARAAMAHHIGDFLATHDHLRNRVLVTTRIVGYGGQLDQYDFQIRTVQPLGEGERRALIKQRYRAMALAETVGWKDFDAAPVLQDMGRRSDRLIQKIEDTPRLAQLATNPLLLSLIVLVHRVKVELPEERALLYRDCVEILTEQWQRSKRADDARPIPQEDLNLSQKLRLLQALALHMQERREDEQQQALLPRQQAQMIIAAKLPHILGSQLPSSVRERQEECLRRAEEWIKGIQVESGILVEQGQDESGDQLISFSHLTFQEYLAAVAINEDVELQRLLLDHLLQPAWREVVLLYVAMATDATVVVMRLLKAFEQPEGLLLAGFCLAEHVRQVRSDVQQLVLTQLKERFEHADEAMVQRFGQVLALIGGSEVTAFLCEQLSTSFLPTRLEAVKALGLSKIAGTQLEQVQVELVKLLEQPSDAVLQIATREALAQIGDPRFQQIAPIVVTIPQQQNALAASPKSWQELRHAPIWIAAKNRREKFRLWQRVFDYWFFTKFHSSRRYLPNKHSFAMSKYLVTNIEYGRFVRTTRHRAPKYWIEGTFPREQATYPVTGITVEDARAYCVWLSHETGDHYRLPTEWEWEWAAAGPQGWQYSWGDLFDKEKCNTEEAALGEITPVGSYLSGASAFGIADCIGNAWEITEGRAFSFFFFFALLFYSAALCFFLSFFLHFLLSFSLLFFFFFFLLYLLYSFLSSPFLLYDFYPSFSVLKGGGFATSSDHATCFFRQGDRLAFSRSKGFRCVKSI